MGSGAYPHTPSEGPLLGTPSSSQTGQGLFAGDGERVSSPCVDAPGSWFFLVCVCLDIISQISEGTPIFTSGRPRATPSIPRNNHVAPPSLLRRLRNGNSLCELHSEPLFTLRINSFLDSVRRCKVHSSGEKRRKHAHTASGGHP